MNSSLKLKRVSDVVIKPFRNDKVSTKDIKGGDVFSLYSNIFLCAKKNSGKTSAIYNILKLCANAKTNIIIFASTVNKDSTWIKIVKRFERTNNVVTYTSLFEDGINRLEEFIDDLQEQEIDSSESTSSSSEEPQRYVDYDDDADIRRRKQQKARKRRGRKGKYKAKRKIAPEYIFVLDDLSTELSKPIVSAFLKKNRHFKCKVILSSQWWNDLHPQARQQLDYLLLFPNIPQNKLEIIHKEADLTIDLPLFDELYRQATFERYHFLYVDVRNEKFRIDFTDEFILPDEN